MKTSSIFAALFLVLAGRFLHDVNGLNDTVRAAELTWKAAAEKVAITPRKNIWMAGQPTICFPMDAIVSSALHWHSSLQRGVGTESQPTTAPPG